jgi:hypothetical protein
MLGWAEYTKDFKTAVCLVSSTPCLPAAAIIFKAHPVTLLSAEAKIKSL